MISEVFLRLELLKHDPDALQKLEEQRRKDREEYLKSFGTVRRTADGAAFILTPNLPRRIDPTDPGNGRHLWRSPVQPPKTEPVPNDYHKLLIAEAERKAAWRPSAKWYENRSALLRFVSMNRKDQAALCAAEMAAEELGIQTPAVRAWRGDETQAHQKWGWVFAHKASEINLTLDQKFHDLIATTAHEVRHCWQFKFFPNTTTEQREKDARSYAADFVQRAFEKKAA